MFVFNQLKGTHLPCRNTSCWWVFRLKPLSHLGPNLTANFTYREKHADKKHVWTISNSLNDRKWVWIGNVNVCSGRAASCSRRNGCLSFGGRCGSTARFSSDSSIRDDRGRFFSPLTIKRPTFDQWGKWPQFWTVHNDTRCWVKMCRWYLNVFVFSVCVVLVSPHEQNGPFHTRCFQRRNSRRSSVLWKMITGDYS